MKRTIYIPGVEKHVTLGQYTKAIKMAKANMTKVFKHGLTCWWSCTGADIMNQFREGMMDRINQAVPYSRRGL